MIRLDKYLAELGVGSRSQVKEYIRKGQVTVNGAVLRDPQQKIAEGADQVCCQGTPLFYAKYSYYMFHKPGGCVTARADGAHRTVMDYLKDVKARDLSPVGRLDLDTEGLLLITNDGALAHRLLSPAHHVEKTYVARVAGVVTEGHVKQFEEGLDIGDEKLTAPARLVVERSGPISQIALTLTEGRFHQVKRMFQAVGCQVVYLKRISMGGIALDEALRPGEYRALTRGEVERIHNADTNRSNYL